jgi:hypothetical protein
MKLMKYHHYRRQLLEIQTVSSLLGNLNYFTRTPIANYDQDGSKKVQLYQDVDLNEIQSYVRGIVGGVEGVSINFCVF